MNNKKLLALPLLALSLGLAACDTGSDTRESVRAVGSSTVYPFAKAIADQLSKDNPGVAAPFIESIGTGAGMKEFCKGVGPQTADVANASRRMKKGEFEECKTAGVTEIVEIQVGLDGIALASAKGGITMKLTPALVYKALAAKPFGKEQTAKTWKDVDPSLPADPILVYGPPSTSGTRDALKELILEAGCKTDPAMKALKDSNEDEYKKLCTEVRSDGMYVDLGEQDNMIVKKIEANTKSVGIFGFSYLEENADKLQGLTMGGVEPTYASISDFSYPGARPLFIYVKKAHLDAIPGLKDFVAAWAANWGKDGLLAKLGMVVSPADVQAASAKVATDMTVMTGDDLK